MSWGADELVDHSFRDRFTEQSFLERTTARQKIASLPKESRLLANAGFKALNVAFAANDRLKSLRAIPAEEWDTALENEEV